MQLHQLELGKSELKFYSNECEMKAAEFSALSSEFNAKKKFLAELDNHEGLIRTKLQKGSGINTRK